MCANILGKGGKNRRRGKNENETEKRELVFKDDGQGELKLLLSGLRSLVNLIFCLYRIRPGGENAGQRTSSGILLRWPDATLSYSWKAKEKGEV